MNLRLIGRPSGTLGSEDAWVSGVPLGREMGAIATVAIVLNRTTIAATPVSTTLIALNEDRVTVTIKNDGSTPLHIGMPSGTAGEPPENDVVMPGQLWDQADAVLGAIFGYWEVGPNGTAPTGQAVVTESVPQFGGASSGSSGGSGSGSGAVAAASTPQATQNANWGGGASAGTIIAAGSAIGHLYSVTVKARGSADSLLTDGANGAELAYIPAGFQGDIPIYAAKFFGTSVYASANCPALSIGVGP